MNIDLTDQVAIVTGAAAPHGVAIARALSAAGARVALTDINPDRIAILAAELRAGGGQVIDIAADVASKFQCVNIVETTRAEWGRLDILVNATLVRPSVSLIKMDEWEWTRCLDVNLKGTFLMSQLVGRVMVDENVGYADANAGRGGTILTLAPQPADKPANVAYAASIAGLEGLVRACAHEYEPLGIRVHALPLPDDADPAEVAAAAVALCG